ncbi:YfcE family phosphodiesterase [Anaerococcus provencensis]|uniref:YfcE family phosphodiesterase n=1 Tax=Anaerococcus provencensis TaxID=938293 RepID=UPI00031E2F64|nr:YfcE family phosphodiesterase [Anaerococcus provencensis]
MKVLVTSDTHGNYGLISDYILENGDIDLLIHAGDGVEDVENIHYETDISYYVVKGNNDFFSNESYDKIIDIENQRIFLSHGHKYGVDYTYDKLIEKAKENKCNIIIHGHTHVYVNKYIDHILILNPGTIFLPRDNNPGFLIMNIVDDNIDIKRISV